MFQMQKENDTQSSRQDLSRIFKEQNSFIIIQCECLMRAKIWHSVVISLYLSTIQQISIAT